MKADKNKKTQYAKLRAARRNRKRALKKIKKFKMQKRGSDQHHTQNSADTYRSNFDRDIYKPPDINALNVSDSHGSVFKKNTFEINKWLPPDQA
jgi:transcription initiation factor TFIIIB Brf1 subunit/transcription initiation factor TFIIB